MTHGIVYYLAGKTHALPLLVSLWALRKWYAGRVALLTTDAALPHVQAIGQDERLNVWLMPIWLLTAEAPNYRKPRNSGPFPREMMTKAALHRWTPFDLTLHLDADTLPLADPSPLFDKCLPGHVLLPTRPAMNPERVANLIKFGTVAGCYDELVVPHLSGKHLPVNTGVMAYWRTAPILEEVLALAMRGATSCRIADELAMQLCYPKHPHVLVGDEWNWSPVWGTAAEPKIMHSPGCRMTLGRMKQPWLAALGEAVEANAGGIQQWGMEEAKQWLSQ